MRIPRKIIDIVFFVDGRNDIIVVDAYSIVVDIRAEESFQPIFDMPLKEEYTGNALAQIDGNNGLVVRSGDQLIIEEALDMSRTMMVDDRSYRIINKCKFGTLW